MLKALLSFTLLAAPAIALADIPTEKAVAPAAAETRIPFASRDIQEWKVDGKRGLWIRSNGKWYYARTMGECRRLTDAINLGFETSATDQLDRFGAIHAQGWRCPLYSVTLSEGPPKKAKHAG